MGHRLYFGMNNFHIFNFVWGNSAFGASGVCLGINHFSYASNCCEFDSCSFCNV